MTDIKLKLTREQQLDNECIKAWELYRLEKAARERAEAALQAQQQGAQVMELVDLSTALARVRARASESGTAKQHGPQFAAGLRAAANMLEGMRIAQPPSTPEPSDEDFERLRAEVEGLREQHGRDSAELRRLCAARDEQRDGRLSALERAVVAERERDAQRARAERAEGRIADAPAVKAMCAGMLTRLQRLSGENPVARVILLPEDWPEIEELIASVNKIAQHEKEPT